MIASASVKGTLIRIWDTIRRQVSEIGCILINFYFEFVFFNLDAC